MTLARKRLQRETGYIVIVGLPLSAGSLLYTEATAMSLAAVIISNWLPAR